MIKGMSLESVPELRGDRWKNEKRNKDKGKKQTEPELYKRGK